MDPRPIWLDVWGAGQWRWLEQVPCRTSLVPLASPYFILCLIGVGKRIIQNFPDISSSAWRGAPDGVANLKVRRGAFDALNEGPGALESEVKLSPPRGRPLKNSMNIDGSSQIWLLQTWWFAFFMLKRSLALFCVFLRPTAFGNCRH